MASEKLKKEPIKNKSATVRYIFAISLTALQLAVIITAVFLLISKIPYLRVAVYLTCLGCVVKIISSPDSPDYKVPWLLFVLIAPIIGTTCYLALYKRRLSKAYCKRLKNLQAEIYPTADEKLLATLKKQNSHALSHAKLLISLADTHLFTNTKVDYFPLGKDMAKSLIKDIKNAKKFIYMEYFILAKGELWQEILQILIGRAKNGVEVKILYDDFGSMKTLPWNYFKTLESLGLGATAFSRLCGAPDRYINNRNHRKITVIDGKIAYTGGINIADEYVDKKRRFGEWKDGGIRLFGSAVYELTKLFITDYGVSVKNKPNFNQNLYPTFSQNETGFVVPFGDGPKPDYHRRVSKNLIINMLSVATKRVLITTPYLILDNEICSAIENTAIRGVDVKIILPGIPDKKLVHTLGQSFYPRLISAGVKIYKYDKGFIHAKNYIVDGKYALMGSINLDYRSLAHHFENGVWLYNLNCIKQAENDIIKLLNFCTKIDRDKATFSPIKGFFISLVKIFAPLF